MNGIKFYFGKSQADFFFNEIKHWLSSCQVCDRYYAVLHRYCFYLIHAIMLWGKYYLTYGIWTRGSLSPPQFTFFPWLPRHGISLTFFYLSERWQISNLRTWISSLPYLDPLLWIWSVFNTWQLPHLYVQPGLLCWLQRVSLAWLSNWLLDISLRQH